MGMGDAGILVMLVMLGCSKVKRCYRIVTVAVLESVRLLGFKYNLDHFAAL